MSAPNGPRLLAIVVAAATAFGVTPTARAQSKRWPLEDTAGATSPAFVANPDRPISSTFQYLVNLANRRQYLHEGIDLLAAPWMVEGQPADDEAPWVVASIAGKVTAVVSTNDPYDLRAYVQIQSTGVTLQYLHLYSQSIRVTEGDDVTEGQRLGRVVCWTDCGTPCRYSHLHFAAMEAAQQPQWNLNPLAYVAPFQDLDPPVAGDVRVCADGSDCDPAGQAACAAPILTCIPAVPTKLDVVADLYDTHDAGHSSAGPPDRIAPRDVEWRHCDESTPDCGPWVPFLGLDKVRRSWVEKGRVLATDITPLFDLAGTCVTRGEYCVDDGKRFRYVVTNVDASGEPSRAGAWDASGLTGHHTVAVRATDYGGNTAMRSVPVCLSAANPCSVTKLTIRDCDGDNGAEPSSCDVGWISPDIIPNPDAAGEPGPDPAAGVPGVIRVCATNTGCASIPGSDKVTFSLDWATTTGGIPFPVGSGGGQAVQGTEVEVSTLTTRLGPGATLPPPDWAVGTERCQDLTWTPPHTGHVCLVGRVEHGADAPTPTPGVTLDNNRAQRNLIVASATASGSALASSVAFALAPLPGVPMRDVALEIDPANALAGSDVRVQLAIDVPFGDVSGGSLVGFVARSEWDRWEHRGLLEACDPAHPDRQPCLAIRRAAASDLAVIEVGPGARNLVFRHLGLRATTSVELIARWTPVGRAASPLEIRVRESVASRDHVGKVELGGLTIQLVPRP